MAIETLLIVPVSPSSSVMYVVCGVGCVPVLSICSFSNSGESHKSYYVFSAFFLLLFSQDIRPFRSSGGNDSDNDCNTEDARGSLEGPTVPGIAVQTGVKVAPASMLGRSSDSLDKKAYIVQDGRDTSAVGLVLFSIYL